MIELVLMNNEDLQEYLEYAVKNYADEKVKSGNWSESEALQKSRRSFGSLLPNGVNTQNQYLYSIIDKDQEKKVGIIWIGIRESGDEMTGVWIWDFMIYKAERGKGYGTLALKELDGKISLLGQNKVSLQVFGHNDAAINLYKKSGYKVTNLVMSKELI